MATQVSLNSGAVASAGTLALQTNGTTEAVSISTGQVATLAQNPILTSGTANGVAYLNGSKALTTGSALTFDGTNFVLGTNGAIRTSGANGYFETQLSYYLNAGGGGGFQLKGLGSGVQGIAFLDSGAGSEYMRLTSTGLGIGTSSPSKKLVVQQSAVGEVTRLVTTAGGAGATTGTVSLGFDVFGSQTNPFASIEVGEDESTPAGTYKSRMSFYTRSVDSDSAPSERMRLDSSGNLGIGTSSPAAKLDVVNSGVSQIQIKNTSGTTKNTQLMFADNSAIRWRIGMDVATNNNTNIFQLYNDTTSSAAFSVDTSGNLGLGVTPKIGRAHV